MADLSATPSHIGKYRIDGLLGQGAMGTVYQGFDPGVGRRVAIKTVRKELLSSPQPWDPAARFRREAQAAGRLSHPHIVTVYDYGEDEACAYLVCEYVEGLALDQWLVRQGRPALPRVLQWMGELLDALACAHAHGVVHRDVKGANLLVTPSGALKLADFGIAQLDTGERTQVGLVLGTPASMAPEQIQQQGVDGRADLFAVGVLLYSLLTGQKPFVGGSGGAEAAWQQVLCHHPPPPSQLNPALPAGFDAVLAQALAKQPGQRYPSAADFLAALRAAAQAAGLPLPPAAQPQPADATVLLPRRARWDDAELAHVETCLREHLGPVARLLVQRTALQAPDLDALGTQLAQRIPGTAERSSFLARIGAHERRTAFTASTTTPTPTAPQAGTLDDPSIARVQNALTLLIGPMAPIAVKRALREAHTLPGLVTQAAAHVPDAQARQRFLGEFGLTASDRTGAGEGPWNKKA